MSLLAAALVLAIAHPGARATCPCETPLVAGFHHEAADGRYVTTTSVVVPAPWAEVSQVLEDFALYPTWLLTGPDGSPTLHDVAFDGATGRFTMTIGAGARGLPLQGLLERKRDAQSLVVRGEGAADDVKAWAFALSAEPDDACAGRTLVELRLDLTYGLKARVFGGLAKSIPSLLPLAARDDLAARFLGSIERLACVGIRDVKADASGAPTLTLDGAPPARLLKCRPGSLGVGSERSQAFGAILARLSKDRRPDRGELIAASHEAIEGVHPIMTWHVDLAGRSEPVRSGSVPGSVQLDVRVHVEERGFTLAFGAGATK